MRITMDSKISIILKSLAGSSAILNIIKQKTKPFTEDEVIKLTNEHYCLEELDLTLIKDALMTFFNQTDGNEVSLGMWLYHIDKDFHVVPYVVTSIKDDTKDPEYCVVDIAPVANPYAIKKSVRLMTIHYLVSGLMTSTNAMNNTNIRSNQADIAELAVKLIERKKTELKNSLQSVEASLSYIKENFIS